MRRPGQPDLQQAEVAGGAHGGRDRVARERADLAEHLAGLEHGACRRARSRREGAERITVPGASAAADHALGARPRAARRVGGRRVRAAPHARRRATALGGRPAEHAPRRCPRRCSRPSRRSRPRAAPPRRAGRCRSACTCAPSRCTFSRAFSGMPAKSGSPGAAPTSAGTQELQPPLVAPAQLRAVGAGAHGRLKRLEREGQRLVLQAQQLAVGPRELERARRRGRARAPRSGAEQALQQDRRPPARSAISAGAAGAAAATRRDGGGGSGKRGAGPARPRRARAEPWSPRATAARARPSAGAAAGSGT